MIKVVIFDFDGTLFDTKYDLARSVNILLKECSLNELPVEDIYKNIGNGADILLLKTFNSYNLKPPENSIERFLNIYDKEKLKYTKPFDGIVDVLEKLYKEKILYIITNKDKKNSLEILSYFSLENYFKRVIGRDTFGIKKPDNRLIEIVKNFENVNNDEIVIVGDSEVDLTFGKNNNIKVVLVTWGGMSDIDYLKTLKPDYIVDNPDEIIELFSKNFI
ncbi:MAG TPA: HAD family hydrolase [Caldisericia bacterium]|nr:HAD family hydrolase [Caldisericia bacterium]HPB34231.1 HAD family hydrolase [Caldisericia bacterium]HQL66153.1 HAD family hydrolase [Caldisericia bacterium]